MAALARGDSDVTTLDNKVCANVQKSLLARKHELSEIVAALKRKRGIPEGVIDFSNDIKSLISDGLCISNMNSGKFDAASVLDALKRVGADACGASFWVKAVTARVEELARFADWAQVWRLKAGLSCQ